MTNKQDNVPSLPIGKIAIVGVGIGGGAVVLFAGLWFGLQALGVSQIISLIMAVCAPIVLMTIALFVLYINRAAK